MLFAWRSEGKQQLFGSYGAALKTQGQTKTGRLIPESFYLQESLVIDHCYHVILRETEAPLGGRTVVAQGGRKRSFRAPSSTITKGDAEIQWAGYSQTFSLPLGTGAKLIFKGIRQSSSSDQNPAAHPILLIIPRDREALLFSDGDRRGRQVVTVIAVKTPTTVLNDIFICTSVMRDCSCSQSTDSLKEKGKRFFQGH